MRITTFLSAFILVIFISFLTSMCWIAFSESLKYEESIKEIADKMQTRDQVNNLLKKAGEVLTFGLYDGYSEELKEISNLKNRSNTHKKNAHIAVTVFFGITCLFFPMIFYFGKKDIFTGTLLVVSLLALIVGLSAPVLMIITYKDIPVLGRVVFMFQSKGILSTIKTSFHSGNYIVGAAILLFSVIIPLIKSMVMGCTLIEKTRNKGSTWLGLIKKIGKWSMADVFVIAILLVFFTMDKTETTTAEIETGLYFFLGYVIFSLIASFSLSSSKTENSTTMHL